VQECAWWVQQCAQKRAPASVHLSQSDARAEVHRTEALIGAGGGGTVG